MTAADELRALSAAATEGPWEVDDRRMYHVIWRGADPVAGGMSADSTDAELIVWCRNHADALADLIDAAQDVDANVDPAVTGNALRDALAAVEADQ